MAKTQFEEVMDAEEEECLRAKVAAAEDMATALDWHLGAPWIGKPWKHTEECLVYKPTCLCGLGALLAWRQACGEHDQGAGASAGQPTTEEA